MNEANYQGLKKPDRQEVAETLADDTTEHFSETQTEVTVKPTENGRGSAGDLARDSAGDFVGGHSGNLTGGAQSQPQQNRNLSGGAQLQPQQDVNAIEVDVPEVSDRRIIEVVVDPTTANMADNLSNSDFDSEMGAHVTYLKKKKEKTKLKAKLERLEYKMAVGFVDEQHQMDNNNYVCQLSLECSKCIRDPNI